ncbi:hypothetical protein ACFS07_13245 [Undibacterium arcticum]
MPLHAMHRPDRDFRVYEILTVKAPEPTPAEKAMGAVWSGSMTALVANSAESLQSAIGELRDLWNRHKFLRISIKAGKDRSIPQNAITHVWYEQIARELREDNALGWKCYCKLHHGVPILRTEDDEFRGTYDAVIKPLSYEQKLIAMRCWPVTSLMTKEQLSKYAEAIQADFVPRGVRLEFPA